MRGFLRLGGLFGRQRHAQKLDEENKSHLQLHIDDNVRAGMTPQEASRAALRTVEQVGSLANGHRQRAGIPVAELVIQDLRYGLRRLRRQPGATLLIGATLGLGVGANAAMLNLVDLLMFRTPAHASIRSASSTFPARAPTLDIGTFASG